MHYNLFNIHNTKTHFKTYPYDNNFDFIIYGLFQKVIYKQLNIKIFTTYCDY